MRTNNISISEIVAWIPVNFLKWSSLVENSHSNLLFCTCYLPQEEPKKEGDHRKDGENNEEENYEEDEEEAGEDTAGRDKGKNRRAEM